MWSRYVATCMTDGGEVEVSAPEFYRILDQMRTCETGLGTGHALMKVSADGRAVPMIDRKRVGQYFTGTRLARSLASLARATAAESILDPMAGSGDMLVASNQIGARPKRIGAIELVAETATTCLARCCDLAPDVHVETGSAFDSRSWRMLDGPWDLVITNPPYVRYQTASTST